MASIVIKCSLKYTYLIRSALSILPLTMLHLRGMCLGGFFPPIPSLPPSLHVRLEQTFYPLSLSLSLSLSVSPAIRMTKYTQRELVNCKFASAADCLLSNDLSRMNVRTPRTSCAYKLKLLTHLKKIF